MTGCYTIIPTIIKRKTTELHKKQETANVFIQSLPNMPRRGQYKRQNAQSISTAWPKKGEKQKSSRGGKGGGVGGGVSSARLTDIKVVEDDIFVVRARDHHGTVDEEASDPVLVTA